MALEEFHNLVGKTLLECQRIEHDIKLIYAAMLKGDFEDNLRLVAGSPLGNVLVDLETLDYSDGRSCLSRNDYKLLREIKNIRNWLAHQSYMEFLYLGDRDRARAYQRSFRKLENFHTRMTSLGNIVEDVRVDIMKRFGRA